MSEEILSPDAGINADTLDEVETPEVAEPQEKPTKAAKSFKKILSEKNAAVKRADEAEAKLAWLDFNEEKVEALIQKAIAVTQVNQIKNNERTEFQSVYWDEKLAEIEWVLQEHPTLSYSEAAKLKWLDVHKTTNPNRLSFSGNTPATLKQHKTTKDLSDDELMVWMKEELAMAGFGNRN